MIQIRGLHLARKSFDVKTPANARRAPSTPLHARGACWDKLLLLQARLPLFAPTQGSNVTGTARLFSQIQNVHGAGASIRRPLRPSFALQLVRLPPAGRSASSGADIHLLLRGTQPARQRSAR